MNGPDKNKILDEITRFYLESRDFNGISLEELSKFQNKSFTSVDLLALAGGEMRAVTCPSARGARSSSSHPSSDSSPHPSSDVLG